MSVTVRFLSVVVSGLVLFGCAATPQNPGSKPPASAAIKDPNCLTETGSRITTQSSCSGFGRNYSQADLQRTGQTQAGDALVLLDPSITVHR
jgi:uncharacterized lipoprotein YajG